MGIVCPARCGVPGPGLSSTPSYCAAAAAGLGGAAASIPAWQSLTSLALWPVAILALAVAAFRRVTP